MSAYIKAILHTDDYLLIMCSHTRDGLDESQMTVSASQIQYVNKIVEAAGGLGEGVARRCSHSSEQFFYTYVCIEIG